MRASQMLGCRRFKPPTLLIERAVNDARAPVELRLGLQAFDAHARAVLHGFRGRLHSWTQLSDQIGLKTPAGSEEQ